MANSKEAKARIKINKLLEESDWRFFDDKKGSANIQLEPNVKITQKEIDAFGEDFETTKNGFIDFLLLDNNGFSFVILEAKKGEKDPLDGKEQARRYAKSENLDRRLSWREFLERIFGRIDKFKDKNELLEEECEKFISIYKPENKYIPHIKNYLKVYIADEYFRNEINNKRFPREYDGFTMPEYQALNGYRQTIPEYVKDYVPVNQFME